MRHYLSVAIIISILAGCSPEAGFDPLAYVDPQVGSVHGRWFFYTPGARPFGMAKPAPHTNAYNSPGSWMPCGYDDRHGSIEGFGNVHEFQIGGLVIMPLTGQLKTTPGTLENPDSGYRSRFSKESEVSSPGYYSVFLEDYGVRAELTATRRVGYHRYTWPESDQSFLLFDVGHRQGESGEVTSAYIRLVDERKLEGFVETYPEYIKFCDEGNRVKFYFAIELSRDVQHYGIFNDSIAEPGLRESLGTGNGLYVSFATDEGEQVTVRNAISYTSIGNAWLNMESESSGIGFDQVRSESEEEWRKMLSVIEVRGGMESDRVKFYTGLYHALLGRGLASDVNGAYPRNDGGTGYIPTGEDGKPLYNHYNTDGIWGGFWNLGQLWALAYPRYLSEYMQSNLDFASETGWLHDGVAAGAYSNGVQTNYNGLMLAATYNSGIRDFDIEEAYSAAFKNETAYMGRPFGSGKYDLGYFVKMGYIPSYDTTLSNGWVFNFGASHTLEFCFSSFAVSEFAAALGREEDAERLRKQAEGYRNLFDPDTRFLRPKYPDGTFIGNFDPMEPWRGFQEGNAFQYTWYVPHDPAGIIGLVGEELFNSRLEEMFSEARKSTFGGGEEIDSFSGLEKLYNHGNQPCLHNAWLFNYSGKPWLTQKWVRAICNEFYGTEPLHGYGYGQDEDQGQLGAWYVISSIGLFDLSGHAFRDPVFQLGSPLFDEVVIHLDRDYYPGEKFIIRTKSKLPGSDYIKSITVNGEPLNRFWIERERVVAGGLMEITLGNEPSMDERSEIRPPSMSNRVEQN